MATTHQTVGTRRLYRLDPRGPAELRAYLDRFWNTALAACAEAVAADAARERLPTAGIAPGDSGTTRPQEDLP